MALLTVAESTGYRSTSTHAEVMAFLAELAALDGTVMRSTQRQEVRDLDRVLQAEAPDTVSSFSEASTSA